MGDFKMKLASLVSEQNFKNLALIETSCGDDSSSALVNTGSSQSIIASGILFRFSVSGIKETMGIVEAMHALPIHIGMNRFPSMRYHAEGTPITVAVTLTAVIWKNTLTLFPN